MKEGVGEQPSSVAPGRPGSAVYPTNPLGEQYDGIATGRDVEWEPLVDFRRMDVSEYHPWCNCLGSRHRDCPLLRRKCARLRALNDEAADDEDIQGRFS